MINKAENFLYWWKQVVKSAGEHYFHITAPSVDSATDKNQLLPNLEEISDSIGVMSPGQAQFLIAACSFRNDGLTSGDDCKVPTLGDLSHRLDERNLEILIGLMKNYCGW